MRVSMVGGSNPSRSVNVSTQRTVNFWPEFDVQGKYISALFPRPGLKTFVNAGAAPSRGMHVFAGNLYAVVGGDVKKITSSGAISTIGTLGTTSGTVSFANNPTQMALVDGDKGYTWDGTTFAQISDAQFPNGATHIVFMDGYGIVNDPANAGRAAQSASNDFTSWAGTDFATAERDPDILKALLVDHRELWLPGLDTTEVWFNPGAPSGFAFEPIATGLTEVGIFAAHSMAKIGDFVYWLGNSKQGHCAVFRAPGLRGERISSNAVEEAFAGYAIENLENAVGTTLYLRGHQFYHLHIPNEATWLHDSSAPPGQDWTEWKSYGLDFFRGTYPVFFNNKHYVADYQDGNIFELDFDTYNDNGQPLERIRRDRHIVENTLRGLVKHSALELEFEAGTGTATLNPQVMMKYSDDGGHTFSNGLWRPIGKVGQYRNRSRWHQLGASRDRVTEISITDDAKTVLIGAYLDLTLPARVAA